MARVTVEDCILKVQNRFELVKYAGRRARQIAAGAPLTVDRDNDKNAVVALREIADETIDVENLREAVIKSYQQTQEPDILEEDLEEFTLDDEAELLAKAEAQAIAADDDEAEADESNDEVEAAQESETVEEDKSDAEAPEDEDSSSDEGSDESGDELKAESA